MLFFQTHVPYFWFIFTVGHWDYIIFCYIMTHHCSSKQNTLKFLNSTPYDFLFLLFPIFTLSPLRHIINVISMPLPLRQPDVCYAPWCPVGLQLLCRNRRLISVFTHELCTMLAEAGDVQPSPFSAQGKCCKAFRVGRWSTLTNASMIMRHLSHLSLLLRLQELIKAS